MSERSLAPLVREVTSADVPGIREILFAALDAGELRGTTPRDLNHEIDLMQVRPHGMLVSLAGDEVAGFFDPEYPLLVVHPRFRRQRHGTRLVERALADALEQGAAGVDLAPPLDNDQAEAFAASLGFAYRSSFWQLRLDRSIVVAPPSFPAGYLPRHFHPGVDDATYLELINRSFADHPTPMNLSLDVMQLAHGRPGFDPSDIAVVPDPADGSQLIAFCRTHLSDLDGDSHAEIGTLGVLPGHRGLGLGRELLRWGIHHLRSRGATAIYLTVEGRNQHALRLYERTGFVQEQEWPRWARAAGGPTRTAKLARAIRTILPDNGPRQPVRPGCDG